jgi:hypothetical protein
MATIDPDGLFCGDRLRRCSNTAQLHWSRLFLASNGFGRLEINYARIVGRAYSTFSPIPSETELHSIIQEYVSNDLLFPYEVAGQLWGQWDTRSELLPRYKTAHDRRSPIPPEPMFSEWKHAYRSERKAFPKSFGNISESFQRGVHGVGVGVGVGEGKNICASDDARLSSPSEGPNQPLDENLPFDTLDDFHTHEAKTTKPCSAGGRTNGTAHRATLEAVASSIHARHPSAHGRRDCSVAAVEKQLSAILKHKHIAPGERENYLRRVDATHAAMCKSEQWTKDAGEFVRALSNYLAPTKERYDVEAPAKGDGDITPRLMA